MKDMAKNKDDSLNYLCNENLSLFTRQSLERGERYFYEDRVDLTYADFAKGEFHANVDGSYSYAVRIDFQKNLIKKAVCNCPYSGAGYCKHIAATLYEIDKQKKNESGSSNVSLFEKIKTIGLKSYKEKSIILYLDDCFSELSTAIAKNDIGEEEIPNVIERIYEVANSYFFIASSFIGNDAVKRISALHLSCASLKETYHRLFSLFYGEAKRSFFFSSVENESFRPIILDAILEAIENKKYYDCRYLLGSSKDREAILSSFSNESIKKLLSLSFGSVFPPEEILKELKKRGLVDFLPFFLENRSMAYDAPFLCEIGEILARNGNEAESKAAFRKMLFARGLTLKDFLAYYESLNIEDREKDALSLEKVAILRGFERAYYFLRSPNELTIKKLNLEEFRNLSREVLSCKLLYESSLKKRIETALAKKNLDSYTISSLLSIFDSYPKEIVEPYLEDSRLLARLNETEFADYFAILAKKDVLEQAGFTPWRI